MLSNTAEAAVAAARVLAEQARVASLVNAVQPVASGGPSFSPDVQDTVVSPAEHQRLCACVGVPVQDSQHQQRLRAADDVLAIVITTVCSGTPVALAVHAMSAAGVAHAADASIDWVAAWPQTFTGGAVKPAWRCTAEDTLAAAAAAQAGSPPQLYIARWLPCAWDGAALVVAVPAGAGSCSVVWAGEPHVQLRAVQGVCSTIQPAHDVCAAAAPICAGTPGMVVARCRPGAGTMPSQRSMLMLDASGWCAPACALEDARGSGDSSDSLRPWGSYVPRPRAGAAPSAGSGLLAVRAVLQPPVHVGVIMDGNGRWAQAQGLSRTQGHVAGVDTVHRLVRYARRARIAHVTVYAFSSQNWARPAEEVRALMKILDHFVRVDCAELVANNVRLRLRGQADRLPSATRHLLQELVHDSASNTGLGLTLALSYGGQEEIAEAAAAAARAVQAGKVSPDQLATPATFASFMQLPDVPPLDLIIRTSGEVRLSNFMLWQAAYAELWVTPVLWPDFTERLFRGAVHDFAARHRRFGKTQEQVSPSSSAPHQASVARWSPGQHGAGMRPGHTALAWTAQALRANLQAQHVCVALAFVVACLAFLSCYPPLLGLGPGRCSS